MAKPSLPDRIFWPLAFLGLGAARIRYLASPGRILDGDEAILGLMAKHLGELSDVSVFFWGQSYGFSLLETLPAALAFRVFGVGPMVLSLTMFSLFLGGIWLYEGGFRNLAGSPAWSRTLAVGLGLLPVWIIWSFKARGGYLTAFLLGGLLLRLLTSDRFGISKAAVVGGAAALLFFAQPLWLAGFLPLLALPFIPALGSKGVGAKGKEGFVMALAALAVAAPLALLSWASRAYWVPEVVGPFSPARGALIPETLYRMFTGSFHVGESWTPTAVVTWVAFLATAGWLMALLTLGTGAVLRRKGPASLVLTGALLGSVAGAGVLRELEPRYFLQASVLLPAALALWIGTARRRFSGLPRFLSWVGLLALAATAPMVSAAPPPFLPSDTHQEAELRTLIRELEERQVAGVYSMDALLQWQLLFYGNESFPVRFASPVDRRPEYPREVDAALAAGRPVALVGTLRQAEPILGTELGRALEPVGRGYFLMAGVSRPFLESLGFTFLPGR